MVAGAIEDELIAAQVGNILDGVVDFLLDGRHECRTLLEEFALGTEVLFLEFCGFLLFGHDGILTGFLLLLREEYDLVLVVFIQCLCLDLQCFDLSLPLLRYLVELFVGALVGRDVLEDIFHVDEGELLGLQGQGRCKHQTGYQ